MTRYMVTPLEKKSICQVTEFYALGEDGEKRCLSVEEHYRWGSGITEDELTEFPFEVHLSEGYDLDDSCASYITYDDEDDWTEEEKVEIELAFHDGDMDSFYVSSSNLEGACNLVLDDSACVIWGPYKVEELDDNYNVVRVIHERVGESE